MSREPEDTHDSLTEREHEILACLIEGLSNHEIAERLHLAHRTVKWYNSQIYSKLGVNSREDAVEQARVLGLLPQLSPDETRVFSRHNLPAQTTPFIGRQDELAEIANLLANPDLRLLTILAPGGMGKTRLALAAAEGQLRHFADGVFFVPLAPLSSPDNIVTTIAEHTGFSFYGGDPPKQQLLDYFRERNALLVLDNFEHLLDGAPLVTDLVQAAPNVKILATSREKLNLSGEMVFSLSGLEFPTWETPEDALEYDAVRLFMQSAYRARSDFELQADDLDYLARVCRLTAGMPLGIVLAAGWLDAMPLGRISAELQRGIDILETEQRDVPERQRSVRASFNYSWGRLTEAEQNVFMKLSVFRGGFRGGAAEMVAGADMRVLRRLVSKALVAALPDDRYDIHELLRQYADEKLLQTDEAEVVRQTHSTYYLEFMSERDADIKGRRQRAGLQEIRADFENIRQAWLWAVERRQYDAISRAALDCLVNFAEMNFSALEAQAMLDHTVTVLQPPAGNPSHPVWDRVMVRHERINFLLGEEIDHKLIEIILERAREGGDEHEMAYCLWLLGDYAARIADYEAHQAYYEECLALRQSVQDAFYIAHTFVGMSGAYARQNEIERGLSCLRQSARIRREIGDHSNLCFSLSGLGHYLALYGQFAEAEALLDETLTIQAEIGKAPVYVGVVAFKAMLAFWRGELDTAARHLRAGQDFARERDYIGIMKVNLALLSWIASVDGDYRRSYALCQQAASRVLTYALLSLTVQWGLALTHCGMGNDEAAHRSLRETLTIAHDDLKSSSFQRLCLPIAAVLAARAGHPERAVELLGLAYSAPQELTGWLAHWQLLADLRHDLEVELSEEAYASAWERGAQLDLETVVEELLAEFEDEA